jgi:lysophospholipase
MNSPPFDRRVHPPGAAFSMWAAPDGWQHRRMDWPSPRKRAARGSLLFAGGRGDFIEKYLEAQHWWHQRGWNVTVVDWRGQGGSRGDIIGGHVENFDVLVDDLSALIGDWRRTMPGPHVAVAHSMGGHVLARLLAERAPALDAAVLVAPMLEINSAPVPSWSAWQLASFLSAWGWSRRPAWRESIPPPPPGSWRQDHLTGCAERYADELHWWEREPGFNLGPPSWGWLDAAYRSCAKLTAEALGGIKVPVLLIGTERDRLVRAAAIERAAALIPKAELLMFKDAAHEILREADGVRLEALSRIDGFFDANAPA